MSYYVPYTDLVEKLSTSIPSNWKVKRAKMFFDAIDERSEAGEEMLLSVSERRGVVPRNELKITMFMAESYEGFKLCDVGDVVINSLWAWSGGIGVSEHRGIVSTAYGVFRIRDKSQFNYRYLNYLLRTKDYVALYFMRSKGIWISRLQLLDKNFLDLPIVCPPVDEQNELVAFLDNQSEKIDRFIQKKRRFIELLKEQRQNIITNAVTKGIDGSVRMRPSGIEWLGDVPEHWDVRRLKNCIHGKLKYGANESGVEFDSRWYRYIRITDFTTEGKLDDENKLSLPPEIGAEYELKDGDILFARSGATVGKTFQFRYVSEEEKYCFAGYLIRASPDEDIVISDFLYNYTSSNAFENWKNIIFNKATIENIGADKYCVLRVPLPPIEEQRKILAHIRAETEIIDTTIAKAEKEIGLIMEYKEAMIAEAVTGRSPIVKEEICH